MKDIFTTQEILVMTNTKFSAREYTAKNENQPAKNNTDNKFAEACWNGMIPEMLPELFAGQYNKKLTLWMLAEGRNLLYAQLGEENEVPEVEYTLNPYALIQHYCEN